MPNLRKAAAYSNRYARPYTRKSKKKSKSYVKAVPGSQLTKFHMGKIHDYELGKFPIKVIAYSIDKGVVQVRDAALEAARQAIHRELDKPLLGNYYFSIRVAPHHILRENKMLTGAGADRMQTGMSHSFGVTIGRAAMVHPGKDVFVFGFKEERALPILRKVIDQIRSKLPIHLRLEVVKEKKKEVVAE